MSAARRAAVIGRWTARIAGTLMALFFLAFFVGEGFPNIFRLPWRESLSVLAISAVVVGLLLAWKWEGLGGAVALAAVGFMLLIGMRGVAGCPGAGGDRVAAHGVLVEAQIRRGGLGGAQEDPDRRGAGSGSFHTALR